MLRCAYARYTTVLLKEAASSEVVYLLAPSSSPFGRPSRALALSLVSPRLLEPRRMRQQRPLLALRCERHCHRQSCRPGSWTGRATPTLRFGAIFLYVVEERGPIEKQIDWL